MARGGVHYYAEGFSGEALDPPTSSEAIGTLAGSFGLDSDLRRLACTSEAPFEFWISLESLEGEVTAYVFYLETQDGPELARLAPDALPQFSVDVSFCDVLSSYDVGVEAGESGIFFVAETDRYPDGEVGARLKLDYSQPTLDLSWGVIKKTYR